MLKTIKKIIPEKWKNDIKKKIFLKKWKKYNQLRGDKKKYILIGTPLHGNLGDHAIAIAEGKFLEDNHIPFFEVNHQIYKLVLKEIKQDIREQDIIMLHGGGYMGTQWITEEYMLRKVIDTFENNKIIIFPQTVFYEEDKASQAELEKSKEIYNKHHNLHIFVREQISYTMAKEFYPKCNVYLVPDIVLYLQYPNKNMPSREGITFVIRKDKEKKVTSDTMNAIIQQAKEITDNIQITDTVICKKTTEKNRYKRVRKKLEEFQKSKLVITDRLHGMIFAIITGTPCLVFSNKNHKIKGVYEWIKHLDYIQYIENYDVAKDYMHKLYAMKEYTTYNTELKKRYTELKECIER